MTRADQPVQLGMKLLKENLLTDAVASAFGLDDAAVPNDVLNILKAGVLYNSARPKYTRHETLEGFPAGNTIMLEEDGVLTPFWVCKHGYESELNGEGRTLILRKYAWNSVMQWNGANTNAFDGSTIDVFLNSTYKPKLSADVQTAMGATTIRYTPGNGNNDLSTIARAVFPLSAAELGNIGNGGNSNYKWNDEGTALDIAGTIIKPIQTSNGSSVGTWSRTPATNKTLAFYWAGGLSGSFASTGSSSFYVQPAFTLPATFPYVWYSDEVGNVYTEQEYEATATDVLGNALSLGAKILTGTYVGTGTYGSASPMSLEFGFAPTIVLLFKSDTRIGETGSCMPLIRGSNLAYSYNNYPNTVTWTDTGVSWYSDGSTAYYQMNVKNSTYAWLAVE